MPDRSSSFTLKMEADVKDIRSSMDKIHGDLTKLKRSFSDWATSSTRGINSVTAAMQRLSAVIGGVKAPGGVGGAMGGIGGMGRPGPSVGGGGGGFAGSGFAGAGFGGIIAASGAAGGIAGAVAAALVGIGARAVSTIVHFGMAQLQQSVQMARQFEYSALNAYGAPGFRGTDLLAAGAAFGQPYGMNAAQALPIMAGIRQQLAGQVGTRGGLVGGRGPAENLVAALGFGTGAGLDAVAQTLAAAQFGGAVQRGGRGRFPEALAQAPGLTIAGYAGALTTLGRQGGVSAFNLTLQEMIPVMQALNAVMSQSVGIQTQLNEETLQFATQGIGLMRMWGRDVAVGQQIMGQAITGMARPGGGDAGAALAYRAVGYRLGMDPIEAQRRLEQGDMGTAVAIFRSIQSELGGVGVNRQIAAIMEIFNLQSVHQADLLYRVLSTMSQGGGQISDALQEEVQQLLRGSFGPMAGVAAGARGQMVISPVIAGIENQQIAVGQELSEVVLALYNFQADMLRAMEKYLPDIIAALRDLVNVVGNTEDWIQGQHAGRTDLRGEIRGQLEGLPIHLQKGLTRAEREELIERIAFGQEARAMWEAQAGRGTGLLAEQEFFWRYVVGGAALPEPGESLQETVTRVTQEAARARAREAAREEFYERLRGGLEGRQHWPMQGSTPIIPAFPKPGARGKDPTHDLLTAINNSIKNQPKVLANPKMFD